LKKSRLVFSRKPDIEKTTKGIHLPLVKGGSVLPKNSLKGGKK